jgi:Lysyl oxidase
LVVLSRAQSGPDDPQPLPAMVDPLLPDLIIAPIEDIGVTETEIGTRRLRFAAMFANVGEGDFIIRADRTLPLFDDWTAVQLINERGGGHTEHLTGATLVYGGDGHFHFHVREAEKHVLETLDGTEIASVVKQGFCFFDTDLLDPLLPGAPADPVYSPAACGSQLAVRSRMGLSVGWGDKYPWNMLEQNIDITNLPDGTYRIREIADPFNDFIEFDETNNEAWAEIRLSTMDGLPQVEVVARSESVLKVRESPSPGVTPTP